MVIALERDSFPKDLPAHIATYWTFATKPDRDASRIASPTLVVSGARDVVLGQGAELAKSIPNARYVEMPEADHFNLALDP